MIGPWQLIFILGVVLFWLVFTVLALIDILKSDFKGNDKLVWTIVVIFVSVLGALLYFTIGRHQKLGKD
jgi:uncharacterized RDD family membrane protein YckC